jgi:hypothetical protein
VDRARAFLTCLAAALAAAACTSEPRPPAAPAGLGKPLVTGPVRAVSASADGAWAAILDGCADVGVASLPPGTASCTLRVAPVAGGEAIRIAGAVTTLPQGVLWSRSGATLAALSEYDYPGASGTLVVWRAGAAPRVVAERVTFFGFGEGGSLGYVAGGRFGLVRADGTERAPGPPADVATFELGGRDGWRAERSACAECPGPTLLRRTGTSGGALVDPCCGATVLATGVTDYGFSPGGARIAYVTAGRDGAGLWEREVGARNARRIATGAQTFAFERRGAALAFVSDMAPGKQGDLHVWSGGKDTLLAREVGEYRWAARAPRLVWLEKFDPWVRAGTVGGGGPGLPPRAWANHVTDVAISADGKHVAFLRHTTRGGYTIDLGLADLDAALPPRFDVVASGVFGFAFSPDGAWLYYQTRCTGEAADACDVDRIRIPSGGLGAGAKAEQVVQGVAGFEFAPDDPERLLVTWRSGPRGSAVDLGVWDRGRLTRVDTRVRASTARFAGPGSRRVVYALADEARAGADVAEVP